MTAQVTSTGFETDGVRLITPANEEFDPLIETLAAPGWAQTLREAAPSIVVVTNDTASENRGAQLTTEWFAMNEARNTSRRCWRNTAPKHWPVSFAAR